MVAFLLVGAWGVPTHAQPGRSGSATRRVVLIVIDGLRADGVTPTLTPHLSDLVQRGSHTLTAECVSPSLTIPNLVSMLTGFTPALHGFASNDDPGEVFADGTILEHARKAGYTTALYLGKAKLRLLAGPGSPNRLLITQTTSSRTLVESVIADLSIPESQWGLSVVHLVEPDVIGHQVGWMSSMYLRAVSVADVHVGRLLEALRACGLVEETLVLVTSDHGGVGFHHIRDVPEVRRVPWVAAGCGVRSGYLIPRTVRTLDTAPTILRALGVDIPPVMEGEVVEEIFEVPSSVPQVEASQTTQSSL